MIQVRPFRRDDRQAVRQICCDVADRGNPIEGIFPDREFAADLLTSYYTDFEPESTFIAEQDGRVIAYINGCLDNRRYGLAVIFLIIPRLILKGLVRGTFFRPECWQILKGSVRNWKRIFDWRKKSFHSHQGHLHIGVVKEARRHQAGHLMMERLLSYASEKGLASIAASVHEGNTEACRFFEQLGFEPKDRYLMMMADGHSLKEYHSIAYVKSIH